MEERNNGSFDIDVTRANGWVSAVYMRYRGQKFVSFARQSYPFHMVLFSK